jgi:phage-related protein
MATFDDATLNTTTGATTPKYGQQKRSAPNTRTVRFADGYEHRILFGLAQHQNPKIFNFTFEVAQADAVKIENFLDARANDSASFDFTPPGEASSSKFVCETWSKSIPYLNRATIQVTFREVFEP